MKVILIKTVPGLGSGGEVKEVREGYARNFLIPQGLADIVSKYGLEVLEARKNKKARMKKEEKKTKEKLAVKLADRDFDIRVRADEKGTLYAALDKQSIRKELLKNKFDISENEIILKKPLKKIGKEKLEINLGAKKIKIKLNIIKE